MPQLTVNLEDAKDCEQAIEILQRQIGHECRPAHRGRGRGRGPRRRSDSEQDVATLPLPQKLKRIQSRGMWKHLVKIAASAEQPLSLPELDELLELPKNKMRSLKAIMAKLENRFDLQFLKVDADAGEDSVGNPRYIMLPNIRRQVLRLSAADG